MNLQHCNISLRRCKWGSGSSGSVSSTTSASKKSKCEQHYLLVFKLDEFNFRILGYDGEISDMPVNEEATSCYEMVRDSIGVLEIEAEISLSSYFDIGQSDWKRTPYHFRNHNCQLFCSFVLKLLKIDDEFIKRVESTFSWVTEKNK